VLLTTGADLLALNELDQKLWVALSCPVKGLELDEKTLVLIDADGDGRIRVPELISAVNWAAAHLKDPAQLLVGSPSLPLAAINDGTADGKVVLAGAKQILASLGRPNDVALHVADTEDVSKIFSSSTLNGDGVIPVEATGDPETQALIKDIIACLGGINDRVGSIGINAEKSDTFFAELTAYLAWVEKSSAQDIAVLGAGTEAACNALKAVRAKVDDYFARCRLAAFDARAIEALNRQESEYLAIAAKDLKITADEVSGFPLARITAGAVGTSLFTTLWESRATLHHAQLAEAINRTNDAATQAMNQMDAGGFSGGQAMANINRMIDQQAYTMAVTDVFYLSAMLFFLLIAVVWLAKPKPGAAGTGGGAH